MKKYLIISFLLMILMYSCNSKKSESTATTNISYPDLKVVGAMKNVMWKGLLGPSIELDTINNKRGLYGLGPESYLTGELVVVDGVSYKSKVISDSTMLVEETFDVSAPFFVYSNIAEWDQFELPKSIKTIKDLEDYINQKTLEYKRPFAFKLIGSVSKALIHIQNLPEGTKVSSPEEAHQGQTNYQLQNKDSEIIGFFSTRHQGVFTHHDSYLHMHLITKDRQKMGHLDDLEIGEMSLYLPKK